MIIKEFFRGTLIMNRESSERNFMGNQSLFRKKSLERITSPEQLQDYMRVTNPGVWLILAVVIVLLVGLIACSAVGRLETKCMAQAVVKDGSMQLTVQERKDIEVKEGMEVRVGKERTTINTVSRQNDGTVIAMADTSLSDGAYDAEIVIESITPISFLLN